MNHIRDLHVPDEKYRQFSSALSQRGDLRCWQAFNLSKPPLLTLSPSFISWIMLDVWSVTEPFIHSQPVQIFHSSIGHILPSVLPRDVAPLPPSHFFQMSHMRWVVWCGHVVSQWYGCFQSCLDTSPSADDLIPCSSSCLSPLRSGHRVRDAVGKHRKASVQEPTQPDS